MKWITSLLCLCIAGMVFVGCGGEKKAVDPAKSQAFATASPEIKTQWDKAMGAASSNDYFGAIFTTRSMLASGSLSPEQTTTAQSLLESVSTKMNAAADKGDAKAQEAVEALRAAYQRR